MVNIFMWYLKKMQRKKNVKNIIKEEILESQIIPTYDPLNLHNDVEALSPDLISFWQKGPSFLPSQCLITGFKFRKVLIHSKIDYKDVIY